MSFQVILNFCVFILVFASLFTQAETCGLLGADQILNLSDKRFKVGTWSGMTDSMGESLGGVSAQAEIGALKAVWGFDQRSPEQVKVFIAKKRSNEVLAVFNLPNSMITQMTFSEDLYLLVVGQKTKGGIQFTLTVIDPSNEIKTLTKRGSTIAHRWAPVFGAHGKKEIVVAYALRKVEIYDENLALVQTFEPHGRGQIWDAFISSSGHLITYGSDKRLVVTDRTSGHVVNSFVLDKKNMVRDLALLSDGTLYGEIQTEVRKEKFIWNIITGNRQVIN